MELVMKECIDCELEKTIEEFSISKGKHRNQCKTCLHLNQKEQRKKDKENPLNKDRVYYNNNKDKISKYNKERYLKNPELYKANSQKWREQNRGKYNAINAKRRFNKAHATPNWLTEDDYWMIDQFYIHAHEQSILIGTQFHVDHIIPLQGKTVSGLHCPTNLQVIPWFDNLSKGNTYTPETWIKAFKQNNLVAGNTKKENICSETN